MTRWRAPAAGLLALLAGSAGAQVGFQGSPEETRTENLRQNMDRAFLWHYLRQNAGRVSSAPEKIRYIGTKIARATGKAFKLKARFYLVDMPKVNASATPGGNVFIYKGILDLGLNDDETAAVVAHEIAHIHKVHWLRRLERAVKAKELADYQAQVHGPSSARVASLYKRVENMQYNRSEELEADRVGAQLMADAGYPPQAMVELLKKVHKNELKEGTAGRGAGASHPMTRERIRRIEALVKNGNLRPRKKRLY